MGHGRNVLYEFIIFLGPLFVAHIVERGVLGNLHTLFCEIYFGPLLKGMIELEFW